MVTCPSRFLINLIWLKNRDLPEIQQQGPTMLFSKVVDVVVAHVQQEKDRAIRCDLAAAQVLLIGSALTNIKVGWWKGAEGCFLHSVCPSL